MSLKAAFEKICINAKPIGKHYVTLWLDQQYYGGPQEGGWWGWDHTPVSYAVFDTEERAQAAHDKIHKLATKLSKFAQLEFGRKCQQEVEWCDARGLDADYLPEVGGADQYSVTISDEPPEARHGSRHWE